MFKDKILARFKEKFPGVNFAKTRLNAIAAKIEAKVVDDETKIDAALDELNTSGINTFAEIAKEDDRVRGIEAKSKQPADTKKEESAPADTLITDDTPAWAKALIESNKKLEQKVTQMEGEKTLATIKQQASAKLKDVPEVFWGKRVIPDNAEALDAFITEVQTDFAAFAQVQTDKGLSSLPIPKGGSGGSEPDKKVSTDVASFMAKQSAALNPQQVTK